MPDANTLPVHLQGRTPSDEPADGYHHIEEAVRVYLCADAAGTGWRVCHSTYGGELFTDYEDGPLQESCECGTDAEPAPECDLWREHLEQKVSLPTAEELLTMMAADLGYQLVRLPDSDD